MQFSPVVEEEWWNNHVEYSKLNRQRLDISTAIFRQPKPKAIVVIVTGWSESYLKYSELIRSVYERGFTVFTYDHQSQGLSGRWLAEHTSTWIHTFDDYVEDFVYCVSAMAKTEPPNLPIYVVAHSMGGLIVSMAMARLPSLISRCVMTSPMFRSKHAIKIFGCRWNYWCTDEDVQFVTTSVQCAVTVRVCVLCYAACPWASLINISVMLTHAHIYECMT
jgi:alpha-beta hydrolase superfamily lysophospholipase